MPIANQSASRRLFVPCVRFHDVARRPVLVATWLTLVAGWMTAGAEVVIAQQGTSLLGKPLTSAAPNESLLAKLETHNKNFAADPSADNLIWVGRFQAYCGDYRAAIATFTSGIEQFPGDARMLRHRGHRWITVREFDKAIADLDQAIEWIEEQPDQIEPDGIPNTRGTPISTLHGNIYYHKGLAHYLKADWPAALQAYQACQRCGQNDDNIVSSGHWIFCTLSRMGKADEAHQSLQNVKAEMDIIENQSYHQACLFYRGVISAEQLLQGLDSTPAGDSVRYAYANWLLCQGKTEAAKSAMREIVAANGWASFGHIAAEADLARMGR